MTSVSERVAAGAAYLDQHDPGWWRADVERAVDLDKLDVEDTSMCVLGQRCPLESDGFAFQAAHLAGDDRLIVNSYALWEWAVELGFAFDDDAFPDDLTAEWRRLIEARRAA